jgi:low affinity Fe/Cu permease
MKHFPGPQLTRLGILTARPAAFMVFLAYAIAWPLVQRDTFDWHGVATLATWGMTLVIQRSEHRDTQAMQAKLDELLATQRGARKELASIDQKEPEEIESERDEMR